jgi:hypothetical protein
MPASTDLCVLEGGDIAVAAAPALGSPSMIVDACTIVPRVRSVFGV